MSTQLGGLLRALRKVHEVRQVAAAAVIGVDRSGYSRIEAGAVSLDISKLDALLAAIVPGGADTILRHEEGRASLLLAMRASSNDGVRILALALSSHKPDPDKLTRFWRRAVREVGKHSGVPA